MAALDALGRKQLPVGLAVLAVACIAIALNWYFTPEKESRSEDVEQAVQAEMRDITFLHGKDGELVWRMQATRAGLGEDRTVVSMDEPEITYAFEGNQTLVASSEKGEYDRANRTAAFWSDVSGQYGAVRFTAERMEYAANEESIALLGGVLVTRGNASIRSKRADLQIDSQRVVFSRDAEVELHAEPK
mgnify:CR=1 FL=1